MSDTDWIDARLACAALGVRPQTLYAYVSRGLLRACRDSGDPRRSLYARPDVEQLARRHRRPRARAEVAAAAIRWGDPVLDTAISDIRGGRLYFAARPATELAARLTLEEVAAHHCRLPQWPPSDAAPFTVAPPTAVLAAAEGPTPLARALAALAHAAGAARPMAGQGRADLAAQGAALMPALAAALAGPVPGAEPQAAPIHRQLAAAWGRDVAAAELIRRALVLLSDHELNPSSFAVRVCASTGASLPAALLAGFATLSGPRHGGVADLARQAQLAAAAGTGALAMFLAGPGAGPPYGYGFGHPLYPEGDPRAADLLAALEAHPAAVRPVRALADRLGLAPNVDAALAALACALDLPASAGFTLFAVGRSAGWIAHAIEQVESGQIIRPRARFVAQAGSADQLGGVA